MASTLKIVSISEFNQNDGDTAMIQRAVNSASDEMERLIVIVPYRANNYILTQAINVPSNVTIQGEVDRSTGNRPVFDATNWVTLITSQPQLDFSALVTITAKDTRRDNVLIEGLELRGPGVPAGPVDNDMVKTHQSSGIQLGNAQSVVLKNLVIRDVKHGILADSFCRNCSISLCQISDVFQDGIHIEHSEGCTIVQNTISNCGLGPEPPVDALKRLFQGFGDGIVVEDCNRFLIAHNLVSNANRDGICVTNSKDGSGSKGIQVLENRILLDDGRIDTGPNDDPGGPSGIWVEESDTVVISDNVVNIRKAGGHLVGMVISDAQNIDCIGNTIFSMGAGIGHGLEISCSVANRVRNINIVGNDISIESQAVGVSGILVSVYDGDTAVDRRVVDPYTFMAMDHLNISQNRVAVAGRVFDHDPADQPHEKPNYLYYQAAIEFQVDRYKAKIQFPWCRCIDNVLTCQPGYAVALHIAATGCSLDQDSPGQNHDNHFRNISVDTEVFDGNQGDRASVVHAYRGFTTTIE